ncbi:YrdB family protein [Nocardioides dokdonensis]|nr:YrdB family protein [Nocardioides dokdonensis]
MAWSVLALLFVVELLAWAAYAVLGWALSPGWLWVWALPLLVVTLWALTASPRARWRGAVLTPAVKTLVFTGAVVALVLTSHPVAGGTLAILVVVVHVAARHPDVRRQQERL